MRRALRQVESSTCAPSAFLSRSQSCQSPRLAGVEPCVLAGPPRPSVSQYRGCPSAGRTRPPRAAPQVPDPLVGRRRAMHRLGRWLVLLSVITLVTLPMLETRAAADLDDIKKAGKIKVGNGIMGLKPYVWQNPDGSYTGLENEMLQYIIKKIGVPGYEYVVTEWQTLIP